MSIRVCIFTRIRVLTDRQTKIVNTFQICWRMLKRKVGKRLLSSFVTQGEIQGKRMENI